MADIFAQLITSEDQQPLELPVLEGTMGDQVVDINTMGKKGVYTLDPGFSATASCKSKITYTDGEKGLLLHRGYPIEQLAERSDFLEVCYLVNNGELPTKEQKTKFTHNIKKNTIIDDCILSTLSSFKNDMHPMAMLCGLMSVLAGKYHNTIDIADEKNRSQVAELLIAQAPVLAAMINRHHQKLPLIQPLQDLSYTENFLHMMFSTSDEKCNINHVLAKAMDRIFLLHADHEQNASTSSVRMTGSTGTSPYMAIASGIAALWGPAHGGANEAVLRMLEMIGDENNIEKYIKKAQDKNDPFRLMGFGHRVYKNFDPRAKVMKKTCSDVMEVLGLENDPLFKIALKLEKIARENDYFIKRKLYPNVDFYSGIILKAIGIPSDMLTVIFATGRIPGWIAQWNEMITEGYRISRPRQLYTGHNLRNYTEIDQR